LSDTEELRGFRDIFFQNLRYLWWPDIDDIKLPTPDRQLELFKRIYLNKNGQNLLKCSLDQFNSILTECYQPSIHKSFFDYFFPTFSEGMPLGDFMKAVMKFMKVALWKYGNLKRAFVMLGYSRNVCDELKDIPFDNICPVSEDSFFNRTPFNFVRNLTAEERYCLGYTVSTSGEINESIEYCRRVGEKNTQDYLSMDIVDVYIATSMRTLDEFKSFAQFVDDLFNNPDLKALNIRYFDPTIAYCKNRITKGLLEALMLQRAKLTLYVAGDGDTFGKDSECAATLVQGKPVIVYVEKGIGEKGEIFDRRAKLFKDIHPLGLQVIHQSGVANGVIVARTLEDCRVTLKGLLLHKLQVRLDKLIDAGYVLKEDKTESILRVATDDALLIRAFNNFYSRES
jgi:hypothetical protein